MKHCVWTPVLCLSAVIGTQNGTAQEQLPQIELVRPDTAIHPGKTAEYTYRLTWEGDPTRWRIPAPEVEQPDWGQIRVRSATTYVDRGTAVTEFALAIVVNETGQFDFPAIDFSVYADGDLIKNETAPLKEPPAEWIAPTIISADPEQVSVVTDFRPWISGAAALGGGLVVLIGIVWAMQRNRPRSVDPHAPATDDPREFVHAARKHRLDGDFYRFYIALGEGAGKCTGAGAAKLAQRHAERAREVGYGNIRPPEDEMDAAIKDTERLIAAARG